MKQQENEKLSDKAFSRLLLTSILGVLLCLVCLCSTTYAWFTGSISSGNNEIKTASECSLSVLIEKNGTEGAIATVDTSKSKTVTLEKDVSYTVTLTLPKDSASGYCIITANSQEYYTHYLQRNDEIEQKLTFQLTVATATPVTFTVRWGIYSDKPQVINNDGTLTIGETATNE